MGCSNYKKFKFETLCVHGTHFKDLLAGAVSFPIYQTSTFSFEKAKDLADAFEGKKEAYIYTRLGNPTISVLEEKMACLEGGESALIAASGMAAISTLVLTLVEAGENIVCQDTLYGGTYALFKNLMPRLGIEVRFVRCTDLEQIEKAIDSKTKLIFIETPSNPTLQVIDIKGVAEIARKKNIHLCVDNTFATPYLQRPLELGADSVIHSATKYIGGHGDAIGGIIIGSKEFIKEAKNILKDIGATIGPFVAWLLIRGLKTLAIRMERHCFNALKVAQFLEAHPKVSKVYYPGLPSHPQHELARKQMKNFGGMVSFELKGGKRAGEILQNSVKLITLAVSLGDTDSLIEHPATTSHRAYSKEELEKFGIPEGLVRISIGIENFEDIIDDLKQALEKV
ncbi:aminotransferase class I/II-fold pyridoxal phosphate-dependent enzyme [Candidatus Aminicenantes bacterium AC-335-B20]|jgi:methionine-gamma-lyase|nr:aminotransferase class I/II-fold pyridoxal phosphate-dependent enzyme [SCandidatus Aminicenantes bacterium Aminicenantia_JdfR_composite]MCP2597543.1 aminotransferase class I/II-fold pyridoxal phosphate-dependent enzyme [Candidatus Aminicenantes bacterium AC-335-G13]MCP2599153.1 aminotransferase class I/II-fold pyridoxal phosphate-dependent enzyme [Candidatus Aminicenantes bacterium AC-335-B20]MCP2618421.1 aminotransferase class I/II-fold pyridoxal phosphate-dependent enzyme [Candidatus Aminic